MRNIIIFKNDRIGDLFHSLNGINQILNEHKNDKITIYLSNYSKDFSFLFYKENIVVKILNYRLNLFEKIKLFNLLITKPIQKIYILSPKNFFYFLPFFFRKILFYAIGVKEINKQRPTFFLLKYLYKYIINDRLNKKKDESIHNLIYNLCLYNGNNQNLINIDPMNKNQLFDFSNNEYCHFHFKKNLYLKKNWSFDHLHLFFKILLKRSNKILLTSDIEETEFNKIFKNKFKTINFKKGNNLHSYVLENGITYLENIESKDLFNLIKNSSLVISPHGTMTVMASYLKVPVLDIFDNTINRIAFYEYKPNNENYEFFILRPFSEKLLIKINRLIKNV